MTNGFTATLAQPSQLIAASVGIPGSPGPAGADGSQWFTGTGAPAPALGNPGDMYLENDGDVWQSSDPSGWLVTPTNIRGPVGATGATGSTGAQGPAGSVSSVGSHLLFSPDATYDIGQSGVSRPRNLYLAGTATVGTSVVVPKVTSASGVAMNIGTTGADRLLIQTNNVNRWHIHYTDGHFAPYLDNAYDIGTLAEGPYRVRNLYLAGTATVGGDVKAGSYLYVGNNYRMSDSGTGTIFYSLSTGSHILLDSIMSLIPAGNVVEQQRGTNPQNLRLYNTYTDTSNYERLSIGWTTNIASIQTQNLGTGVVRGLVVQATGGSLGFYGASAAAKPTVSGAKGSNAALASLLTALSTIGLVTDSSS